MELRLYKTINRMNLNDDDLTVLFNYYDTWSEYDPPFYKLPTTSTTKYYDTETMSQRLETMFETWCNLNKYDSEDIDGFEDSIWELASNFEMDPMMVLDVYHKIYNSYIDEAFNEIINENNINPKN